MNSEQNVIGYLNQQSAEYLSLAHAKIDMFLPISLINSTLKLR